MIKTILKEAKRLWLFLVLAGILMITDIVASQYILFGIGCISAVLVFSHLVRKLLHPYVDLQELYFAAKNEPMPAAIVLCAFIYLTTTVLNVAVQFLK